MRIRWPGDPVATVKAVSCIAILISFLGITLCSAQERADESRRPFKVKDSIELSRIVNPTMWTVNQERREGPLYSPDGTNFVVITEKGVLSTNEIEATIWLFNQQLVSEYLSGKPAGPVGKPLVKMDASINTSVISDVRWIRSDLLAFLGRDGSDVYPCLYTVDVGSGSLTRVAASGEFVTAYDIRGNAIAYTTLDIPANADNNSEDNSDELTSVLGKGGIYDLLYPRLAKPEDREESELLSYPNTLHIERAGKEVPVTFSWGGGPLKLYAPVLFLSPDEQSLITIAPVHQVPEEWSEYELADTYLRHHFSHTEQWDIDESNPWKASEYVLVDLQSGLVSRLVDAPAGPGTFYFRYSCSQAVWSSDGKYVILANTFLPLDVALDRAKRFQRSKAAAVALVNVATHVVNPIAYISSKETTPFRQYLSKVEWDQVHSQILLSYIRLPDGVPAKNDVYKLDPDDLLKASARLSKSASAQNQPELFVDEDLNRPPTLAARLKEGGETRHVWDPNPQLHDVELGTASIVKWKDEEGNPRSGILVLPPNYAPTRRYPLVIQTHGYDEHRFFSDGAYTTGSGGRALAASGIVVLQMDNVPKYTNTPKEGPYEVAGFVSAIKSLAAGGIIEPSKVGVIGFSYTCFAVLYSLTHEPDLFAAAAITDGNNKSYSQYLFDVDIGGETNPFLEPLDGTYGSSPYGDGLANWAKDAPGFNLYRVKTPLLVSSLERGALFGQWEIYAGLRASQKPVEMLWVPSQRIIPHLLVRPADRYMSQQSAVDWFRFWLQGYEDPDSAKAEQYKRWRELRKLQEAGGVAGDLSGHGDQCRRRLAGESRRRNVPAGPNGGLLSGERKAERATRKPKQGKERYPQFAMLRLLPLLPIVKGTTRPIGRLQNPPR